MFLAYKLLKTNYLFTINIFKVILILVVCNLTVYAQPSFYQPFSVGVGYGVTIAYAGEETLTASNATVLSLNYQFTPFSSISVEGQFGQLSGGDATRDSYGKQFLSNYTAIMVHADLQAGQLLDFEHSEFLNGIKNFYAGIGLGLLTSKITNIQTLNPADVTVPLIYLDHSSNIVIPLRLGYEFKIKNKYAEPQFRFDINYSLNTSFGTGLDGYINIYSKATPIKFYNYLSIGVKYSFGSLRSYQKQIFYSNF